MRDAVIVSTARTPLTKAARGSFNNTPSPTLGAFSVKARDARLGRNPRTGESVQVDDKKVPFFKTGKLLRDRLNER